MTRQHGWKPLARGCNEAKRLTGAGQDVQERPQAERTPEAPVSEGEYAGGIEGEGVI
jgi:hypothetical protein